MPEWPRKRECLNSDFVGLTDLWRDYLTLDKNTTIEFDDSF